MGETDHIIKKGELVIIKKSQFNLYDLYRTLKAWFDLHEYDFYEREYEEKGKKVSIKWEGQKKADDYMRYKLSLSISLSDYEIIETNQGKSVDGDLKIEIKADIENDYEDKWSKSPFFQFFKATSDKFIAANRRERREKELKDDCYDIFNRTKSYLNLQKFK